MIRLATQDDIDFIAELELSVFPDHGVNEYGVKQVIDAGMVMVFSQVGYIITHWGSELIDILRVGVHPDHRGRGIGHLLLDEVLSRAWLPVMLTVQQENTRAIQLYSALDFHPVSLMPQDTAIVMMRKGPEK